MCRLPSRRRSRTSPNPWSDNRPTTIEDRECPQLCFELPERGWRARTAAGLVNHGVRPSIWPEVTRNIVQALGATPARSDLTTSDGERPGPNTFVPARPSRQAGRRLEIRSVHLG